MNWRWIQFQIAKKVRLQPDDSSFSNLSNVYTLVRYLELENANLSWKISLLWYQSKKKIRNPSVEHRFCADGDFCGPKISQIPSYFQSIHKESTFEMARFWIFRNEISNKKIQNDDHVAIDFLNLFEWNFKWKWFVKIWIKGILLDCCFLFL